jgi:hypothetical protein
MAFTVTRAGCHRCTEHRVPAGLFDERCEAHGRSEGRDPTRDACGSRRNRAAAVARVASARHRMLASRPRTTPAPRPASRLRVIARPVCSRLPAILPGAFAKTCSSSTRLVCSATVLDRTTRLRAWPSPSRAGCHRCTEHRVPAGLFDE